MQYDLGPFRASLDDRDGAAAVELRRGSSAVAVPEQAGRLLALLLASPGATLSPHDIVRGVWRQEPGAPGCRIDEDNVRVLVAQLRKLLEDDGRTQRLVQTVPHRGYRLQGAVRVTPRRRRRRLLPAAAAAVTLGAAFAWRLAPTPPPSRPHLAPTPPVAPQRETPSPVVVGRREPRARAPRPPEPGHPEPSVRPAAEALTPSAVPPVEERPRAAIPSTVPDTVPVPAPVPGAPPRPPSDRCPLLEALVTRLVDQDVLMKRLCGSRDVGGVLNASGAVFDLTGLSSDLGSEIDALTAYARHLELFLPVGREAEAARAVRAECRDIRLQRSLWQLAWTAVRSRAEELRALAACDSRDIR